MEKPEVKRPQEKHEKFLLKRKEVTKEIQQIVKSRQKAIYFPRMVDVYFNDWIKRKSCFSGNSADDERFYQFFKAFQKWSRKRNDTGFIYEKILEATKNYHPELNQDFVNQQANIFVEKAKIIFNYERASFPCPLVERRDPNAMFIELNRLKVPFEEIEQTLIENFGEKWELYRS